MNTSMHHYRVILIAPPTGDRKLPALRYICLNLYIGQKFQYFWIDHWNNSHFSCAAAQCACDNICKRTRSLDSFDPSTIRIFSDALKITWSTLISDHMVGLETSLQPTSESLPYLCTREFLRVNLACPLTSLDWKRKISQMATEWSIDRSGACPPQRRCCSFRDEKMSSRVPFLFGMFCWPSEVISVQVWAVNPHSDKTAETKANEVYTKILDIIILNAEP